MSRTSGATSQRSPRCPLARVLPVTVRSGLPGAGKTTLSSHVLCIGEGSHVAAIVHDMSEVNIDALLISEGGAGLSLQTRGLLIESTGISEPRATDCWTSTCSCDWKTPPGGGLTGGCLSTEGDGDLHYRRADRCRKTLFRQLPPGTQCAYLDYRVGRELMSQGDLGQGDSVANAPMHQ